MYNFLSSQEQKGNAFERHLLRDILTSFCSSPPWCHFPTLHRKIPSWV